MNQLIIVSLQSSVEIVSNNIYEFVFVVVCVDTHFLSLTERIGLANQGHAQNAEQTISEVTMKTLQHSHLLSSAMDGDGVEQYSILNALMEQDSQVQHKHTVGGMNVEMLDHIAERAVQNALHTVHMEKQIENEEPIRLYGVRQKGTLSSNSKFSDKSSINLYIDI
jgi:hypothetical protein